MTGTIVAERKNTIAYHHSGVTQHAWMHCVGDGIYVCARPHLATCIHYASAQSIAMPDRPAVASLLLALPPQGCPQLNPLCRFQLWRPPCSCVACWPPSPLPRRGPTGTDSAATGSAVTDLPAAVTDLCRIGFSRLASRARRMASRIVM